ncbi:MAG: hypothetical protein KUG81_06890 [Gammaproteobacteria bacterium]|nr:hypothetical protein [Gammaproteobacteria bacterium]
MLKSELEGEIKRLKKLINTRDQEWQEKVNSQRNMRVDFEKRVEEAVEQVLKDACSDSHEYVQDFCNHVGIDYPTQKLLIEVEVPIGLDIETIYDSDGDRCDWEDQ